MLIFVPVYLVLNKQSRERLIRFAKKHNCMFVLVGGADGFSAYYDMLEHLALLPFVTDERHLPVDRDEAHKRLYPTLYYAAVQFSLESYMQGYIPNLVFKPDAIKFTAWNAFTLSRDIRAAEKADKYVPPKTVEDI